MKCILMNKNNSILVAEYNNTLKGFDKIYEVLNIEYAPYILYELYDKNNVNDEKFLISLNDWFKGRGIPSWRDKLDLLLHRLGIRNVDELLDKSFGLSLSDQYWIKPYDLDIKYDDINFFEHDFEYSEFMEASFSLNNNKIVTKAALTTPNNTTDGMLKKAWIIENKDRYLLKSGYKNDIMQPFNEILASEICRRLGFEHIDYILDIYNDIVVSKCKCFINKDTELITANQILNNSKNHSGKESYEEYIKILEDKGISNVREKLENMFILDYIILNEDRHLNNFGIVRNVETLKWINIFPIFDNGQSLNIKDFNEEEILISGEGRFFYEVLPFDDIIKYVNNINRIDLSLLKDIPEWYDNLLHKYQHITNISDGKIERICTLLARQIKKLGDLQK